MLARVLSSNWFQLVGIPLILVIMNGLLKGLASQQLAPLLEHWVLGLDLCLQGWAINLGLASYNLRALAIPLGNLSSANDPKDVLSTFLWITIVQLLILIVVTWFLRYFLEPRQRLIISNFLGLFSVMISFFGWNG
jgi:hypothetical protein